MNFCTILRSTSYSNSADFTVYFKRYKPMTLAFIPDLHGRLSAALVFVEKQNTLVEVTIFKGRTMEEKGRVHTASFFFFFPFLRPFSSLVLPLNIVCYLCIRKDISDCSLRRLLSTLKYIFLSICYSLSNTEEV